MVGDMRMSKLCQSDTKLSYLVGGLNSKQTLQIAQFYPKGNSIILSIMSPTLSFFYLPSSWSIFPIQHCCVKLTETSIFSKSFLFSGDNIYRQ